MASKARTALPLTPSSRDEVVKRLVVHALPELGEDGGPGADRPQQPARKLALLDVAKDDGGHALVAPRVVRAGQLHQGGKQAARDLRMASSRSPSSSGVRSGTLGVCFFRFRLTSGWSARSVSASSSASGRMGRLGGRGAGRPDLSAPLSVPSSCGARLVVGQILGTDEAVLDEVVRLLQGDGAALPEKGNELSQGLA